MHTLHYPGLTLIRLQQNCNKSVSIFRSLLPGLNNRCFLNQNVLIVPSCSLSTVARLSPTPWAHRAQLLYLTTQYCVVSVFAVRGRFFELRKRGLQNKRTNVHTHSGWEPLAWPFPPLPSLSLSTCSHKRAHSHCCTIKQAFVFSHTATQTHAYRHDCMSAH